MFVRQSFAQRAQILEQGAVISGSRSGSAAADIRSGPHAFWLEGRRYVDTDFLSQHLSAVRVEREHRIAILSLVDESLMEEGAGDAAPFVDRSVLPDTVDAQGVMAARQHTHAARTAQDVDDLRGAKALPAL